MSRPGLSRYSPVEVRFWSRVDKTPGLGPRGTCWEWTGTRNKAGYGQIRPGGQGRRLIRAHRMALILAFGDSLQKDFKGLHACNHPPCVRVESDHVYPGTHAENMQDIAFTNLERVVDRHNREAATA